jgi:hypothetical protein
MISDTVQNMFPAEGHRARSPALGDLKLMPIDYAYIEKETGKTRFNEVRQ